LLELKNVKKSFGGVHAVDDVSFTVKEGEVVGLIGPNGAGKSTLINLITGVFPCDKGSITFLGKDITGKPPHMICKAGLSRTYQIPQPFYNMTCLLSTMVSVLNGKERENMSLSDAALEASYYLEFVGLFSKRDSLARDLNLYDMRMLELARALATTPKLLLIDETMAGLNPVESQNALDMIRSAQDQFGITILWIEHVMKIIMSAAQRIVVLHYGRKIAEGLPSEIFNDDFVVKAYLGDKHVKSK